MKCLSLLAIALLAAWSTAPQAETLSKAEIRELDRQGATCEANKNGTAGETHRCLFAPGEFDGRNFSTERGRSSFVISELGHRCKEIEILDDVDYTRDGESAPSLRRVSAQCIR